MCVPPNYFPNYFFFFFAAYRKTRLQFQLVVVLTCYHWLSLYLRANLKSKWPIYPQIFKATLILELKMQTFNLLQLTNPQIRCGGCVFIFNLQQFTNPQIRCGFMFIFTPPPFLSSPGDWTEIHPEWGHSNTGGEGATAHTF